MNTVTQVDELYHEYSAFPSTAATLQRKPRLYLWSTNIEEKSMLLTFTFLANFAGSPDVVTT